MKRPRRSEGIYDVVPARCRKGQGKWGKERIAKAKGVGRTFRILGFPSSIGSCGGRNDCVSSEFRVQTAVMGGRRARNLSEGGIR